MLRVRAGVVDGRSVLGCRFVDLDLDQQQNLVRRIYGAGDGRLRHDNDTLGLLGTMFRRLFKPSAD